MGDERKPTNVTDLRSQADVYRHYGPETHSDETPSWAKRKERTVLRAAVDTGNQLRDIPRPVTPGAKDVLKKRTKDEIFGNIETQNWYIKTVRESLERPSGDTLYDFIRSHPKYAKTSHQAWNRDFAAFVGVTPPSEYHGSTDDVMNRRFVAAAQHVLVEEYEKDVFQITLSKKLTNPWIFIDGKMGPYTVSVLNDFWMGRYSKESTKKPQPPGRSGLDDKSYKPDSRSSALYTSALEYLNVQGKDGPRKKDQPTPTVTPGPATTPGGTPSEPKRPEADFIERIKAKYAELDKAGDSVKLADLEIKRHMVKTEGQPLSAILGAAYGENPKDAAASPHIFRLLNLLAQAGQNPDTIRIHKGETLNVTSAGLFTVNRPDASYTLNIQLPKDK